MLQNKVAQKGGPSSWGNQTPWKGKPGMKYTLTAEEVGYDEDCEE